jgi:LysM repeat protein
MEVGRVLSKMSAAVIGGMALLGWATPASGYVVHSVARGETLWSIAALNGLPPSAVAAANGLPVEAHVVAGATIRVPSAGETVSAGTPTVAAPGPMGAYRVRLGDTLSGIAGRTGISVSRLAWMNGVDPAATLLAGTPLKLPTGSPAEGASSQAPPTVQALPAAPPQPTGERVTAGQVSQIALQHGVPPSLAAAIARQESGFNNGMVSGANARGVMQILPGTWAFIQSQLAGRTLDPTSASDNVDAGVTYLGELLRDAGGDESVATAAYYQGLSSVRRVGMLPATRRYVANVMALRTRYGG